MRDQGLGSWPVRRRRLSPAHVAFVQGDTRRSYAALDDRTRHLAAALRDLGVQRGDRVAYLGPNDPTLLETLFATTALGGVFVPLNWRPMGRRRCPALWSWARRSKAWRPVAVRAAMFRPRSTPPSRSTTRP